MFISTFFVQYFAFYRKSEAKEFVFSLEMRLSNLLNKSLSILEWFFVQLLLKMLFSHKKIELKINQSLNLSIFIHWNKNKHLKTNLRYRKDRVHHSVFLSTSYIVKRSILFGRGNAKWKLCKSNTKQSGVRYNKQNKLKLLHRIASVQTFTNLQ